MSKGERREYIGWVLFFIGAILMMLCCIPAADGFEQLLSISGLSIFAFGSTGIAYYRDSEELEDTYPSVRFKFYIWCFRTRERLR